MAKHAESEPVSGLTAERAKAIAGIVVAFLTGINAVLTAAGKNPLPFSDNQVYTAVSNVLWAGSTVYVWWKDQNMTPAAVHGSNLTTALKSDTTDQGINPPDTPIGEVGTDLSTIPSDSEILAATKKRAGEGINA